MPKMSRKHKSRKQKLINMKGCSKKHRRSHKHKSRKYYLKTLCPKCGIFRHRSLKGGEGCGPSGCPIPPLSWAQMNTFKGGFPLNSVPKQTVPLNYGPILGPRQKGGCNDQCGLNGGQVLNGGQALKGGSFYKPSAPVPGPFVGSPWGSSINKWPAIDGISGDRNYLKPYKVGDDPALQMSLNDAGYTTLNSKVGGRKTKRRGGGLVPQDLINLGRDVGFNFKSAYNALNGYTAPINPLPYKDQLTNSSRM